MKLRCLILAVFAVLALAPAALAASGSGSAGTGYGGNAGEVQNDVSQGAVHAAATKGTLPFTGLDLALLVVGGLALVVVGAGLRRASRRPAS
jgi:hypothetical protein